MVGVDEHLRVSHCLHRFLPMVVDVVEISGILGIGKALVLNQFAIPHGVQVGVLPEPTHLHAVATEVVHVPKVHGAETVAREVDIEDEGIVVLAVVLQEHIQAVHGAELLAPFLGVVGGEGGDQGRVGHARIEVLEMPNKRGGIDSVALDFVGPCGEVNHALLAENGIHLLACAAGEIVVGKLRYNAVPLGTPCKGGLRGRE